MATVKGVRAVAGYLAVAVSGAAAPNAERATTAQLSAAMDSRAGIERAEGILMGQRGISAEAASARLATESQHTSVTLREAAARVIAATTSSISRRRPRIGDARRGLWHQRGGTVISGRSLTNRSLSVIIAVRPRTRPHTDDGVPRSGEPRRCGHGDTSPARVVRAAPERPTMITTFPERPAAAAPAAEGPAGTVAVGITVAVVGAALAVG